MKTDTPRTDAVPKRYMTVVYEIVDETEWRKTNPLKYAHNGLSAVTVSAYDAIELLDEAEAEVERLNNILENTRMSRDTMIEDRNLLDQELAASQAEVERLNKRPFGCKCETFREKALGDGCEECNKALVIELLTDERDELEAEVERLKILLSDLLTLTEKNYWNSHNYNQIKEAINPTNK